MIPTLNSEEPVKRHECYPEFYKLMEICNGNIRRLRGLQRTLNFENVNAVDIESYMNDKLFTTNDKENILSLWDTNRHQAINALNYRLQRINYNEAEEKFIEANDYYFFNVLFLSEDVEKIARDLLDALHSLWINYDPDYSMYGGVISNQNSLADNKNLIKQIDTLRSDLKAKMRQELFPS